MRLCLIAVALVFGVAVSVRAQFFGCSKRPPYPWYNLAELAVKFVASVPRIVPLCDPRPAEEVVKFYCKTSGDDQYYNVDFSNQATYSRLNPRAKWAFVVHGFLGTCYRDWPIEMLRVLSASEPMNVCCVDWSRWAACNYAPDALKYVYAVGDYLADTVETLHDDLGIDLNRFIIIGHSFGGIITGIAGKRFRDPKLPIGIALDPAGILYSRVIEVPANRRLSPTDYTITKTIITDENGLGSGTPTGSINIFANRGKNQPNCDTDVFPCSHFTATLFFIESMRQNQKNIYPIISKDGRTRDHFTLYANDVPGNYNLTTTRCFPYASPPLN